MSCENIESTVEIKPVGEKSDILLYSLTWTDVFKEIMGISDGYSTDAKSSTVESVANCHQLDEEK